MMVSRVDAAIGNAVKRVLNELFGDDEAKRPWKDGRAEDVIAGVVEIGVGAGLAGLLWSGTLEDEGGKKDISDSGTRRILEDGDRSARV